jgi:hypothetical protein
VLRTGGVVVAIVSSLLGLTACGGGGTSPTSPSPTPTATPAAVTTTLAGTLAGSAGQSGTFTAAIQAAVALKASGAHSLTAAAAAGTLTLINGGATSALTGTFETSTGALTLSGGGFLLNGMVAGGAASGTYTGPNDSSGRFAGFDSSSNPVKVFCGRYSGSDTGTGTWNIEISASGAASGLTCPDVSRLDPKPRATLLTGQLTGTTLTLRSEEDGQTATGVVEGNTVSGTHDNGLGTFSGSADACH